MPTKSPFQSKTILINAALGILMAISAFVPAAAGIADYIKAHALEIGSIWAILGMGLRMISNGKIVLGE